MGKRIAAIWLSVVILLGFIVIVTELAPNVKGSTIIFVDDEPGTGPGNPPEDYTNIQNAIDAASDGDTVFVYNGIYFESVEVDKTINLTGEDRDNTILDTGAGVDLITITSDWVNVSGLTVTNSGGDGVYLNQVQNCRVFNNRVDRSDMYGISLRGSNNNSIVGNVVQKNYDGIRLSDGSSGNNIVGNIADGNNNKGIVLSKSNKNRLVNNNVSFNSMSGIAIWDSNENTLKDNMMENNGIYIQGDNFGHWNTHNIDTSNTVNGKPVQYWKNRTAGKVPSGAGQVILSNCTNVNIEGQELTFTSAGILLAFSSKNSITGNNVSSNRELGIYLFFSNENNITGNDASFCGLGITLDNSIVNNIIDNTVFSNEFNGIDLLHYSSTNQIIGNKIFSNDLNGIGIFSYSSDNQILSNTISFNGGTGISLGSNVLNNTIFYNNLINNSVQAADETNNGNYWDNGYPTGGNFWSDYDRIDLNSTPSQDVPPPDGIGDTPYIIDTDSQDNYPLMELIINRTFLYEGWNLISIPFIQSDTNLDTVLNSIKGLYDAVQWYNVSDTLDLWKHNHIQKPSQLNDLIEIDHTMGFWIHITEPSGVIFEYNGNKPTLNQSIPLHIGWNLVGYPSLTSHNRTNGLNNIMYGPDVDCIQWYDASSKTWHFMGSDDLFLPGRGYWVHSKIDTVWDVPL